MKLEDVFYAIDRYDQFFKFERDEMYNELFWMFPLGGDGGTFREKIVIEKIESGEWKVITREEALKYI